VSNQENSTVNPFMNISQIIAANNNMEETKPTPYSKAEMQPVMTDAMQYQSVYPEIFYKLHPYITMVCDEMDAYGCAMPTREMVSHITDNIYDDICKMYPDLAEYTHKSENSMKNDPPDPPVGVDGLGRGFRRRGLPRDLIDILLLSEMFRRRRRNYY